MMKTKIDGRQILKKLDVKSDRGRTTFYISKSVYKEFRKQCGNVTPSLVLEELMKQFIESTR